MEKKALWEGKQFLISQIGLKQLILPNPSVHSASWDAMLTSDNRLFFSLCSEQTTSEYAKLAEYDYDTNTVKECFYTKNTQCPQYRFIRDSKFHTSISEMEDGNLIMATHTTDKSPVHPVWMPEAYYGSPWEGFPGSTLYTYNVKTGDVHNLGIPAPRESIYGGAYDKKNRMYYMMGCFRGHLYRYSMDDGQVEDMGQVLQRRGYRMKVGSDGNLYFTTRNGYLQRINTDTNQVEDLNTKLPDSSKTNKWSWGYLCEGKNGPDGRLYISTQFHNELVAYDPKTNTLENFGTYYDADSYVPEGKPTTYIAGMDFDANDVLWLVICSMGDPKRIPIGATLIRWDITRNEKPELMGVPGTQARAVKTTSGVYIDKTRNILYIIGSNHADDSVDINAIDINEFEKHMYEKGPDIIDPFFDPAQPGYEEFHATNNERTKFNKENYIGFKCKKTIPVHLWREMPYSEVKDSKVRSIRWENGEVVGICGENKYYSFRIDKEGHLLEFKPTDERPVAKEVPEELKNLKYACYPGRQYKARPDKAIQLEDGSWLVATLDGIMAVVKDGKAFSLGTLWSNGPVHDMCWVESQKAVYGVAGDVEDLGYVFRYTAENGMENFGRVETDGWEYGYAGSCNLSCCAAEDDILAIGAEDQMGCVYLCTL